MTFWIETKSPSRRREWERVFGTDRLPVTTARPIGLRFGRKPRVAAYVLDVAALHPMAVCRLAGRIARQQGIDYQTAVGMLEDGWLIPAENCELATGEELPAFLFGTKYQTAVSRL